MPTLTLKERKNAMNFVLGVIRQGQPIKPIELEFKAATDFGLGKHDLLNILELFCNMNKVRYDKLLDEWTLTDYNQPEPQKTQEILTDEELRILNNA